jgi:holo-ACP synthase CitX
MTPLEEVLAGREERAKRQRGLLEHGAFALQIILNVPGWPKHIDGEERIIVKFHNYFIKSFSIKSKDETIFANGAGLCCLLLFDGSSADALRAKRLAVKLEEEKRGGRLVDMDVITKGSIISRADLKLPPRKCIVCGSNAKSCAQAQAHTIEEVRAAAEKIAADLISKKETNNTAG